MVCPGFSSAGVMPASETSGAFLVVSGFSGAAITGVSFCSTIGSGVTGVLTGDLTVYSFGLSSAGVSSCAMLSSHGTSTIGEALSTNTLPL